MDHVAMRFWIKRQDKLIHDYSLTGYLLSPNPTIMAHTYENRSVMHTDAVVHLIDKLLIVNPTFVGEEKSEQLSKDIDTFWDGYDNFVNRRGCFSHKYMWDAARGDDVKANRWHQRYSLQGTKVLGKLACLVLSKILGIGTAERNWKQVKYIKLGLRSNTDTDKVKKQAAFYGQYQQIKTCVKQAKLSSAGKLWEENNFKSLKMDEYCKDMWQSLDGADKQPVRIFRNWQESWEKKKLGTTGNVMLHEKLKVKYVGLKLDENEGEHRIFTVHAVQVCEGDSKKILSNCSCIERIRHNNAFG